jgi:hypothetical protein
MVTHMLAYGLLAAAAPVAAGGGAQAVGSERGPRIVQAEEDDGVHAAATVIQLDHLNRIGNLAGKLFATAGGDPAMNGLYTYLAFYESPAEGFRIFMIGDFEGYRIVSQAPGRVTLSVRQTSHDGRSGQFTTRTRRLNIAWPVRGDTVPSTVTVTEAR